MQSNKKLVKNSSNTYYMYGKHAIFAAIKNDNRQVSNIYCLKKTFLEFKNKVHNFHAEIVSSIFIEGKIGTGQPHQGIIALVHSIFLDNIDNLSYAKGIDRIVILDQVTDPQNIGAIVRSATAFGFTKLILLKDYAPEENAVIAKVASGSLELIEVAKVTNLKTTIEILKKKGFWISGLDLNGKDSLSSLTKFDKIVVVIGSEGKGMRYLTKKCCDFLIRISISNEVQSLNASSAASIIFHSVNQR